jgi:hypothetical protein
MHQKLITLEKDSIINTRINLVQDYFLVLRSDVHLRYGNIIVLI